MPAPKTYWVSPNRKLAIAKCHDIPNGVLRGGNRHELDACIRNLTTAINIRNDLFGDTYRGNYFALVARKDLPWEIEGLTTVIAKLAKRPSAEIHSVELNGCVYEVTSKRVNGRVTIVIDCTPTGCVTSDTGVPPWCGTLDTGVKTATPKKKSNAKKAKG